MKKNKRYTKQFKSDDPTTYLTDVNQQKNMLLDMIDDEVEKKVKKVKKIQNTLSLKQMRALIRLQRDELGLNR